MDTVTVSFWKESWDEWRPVSLQRERKPRLEEFAKKGEVTGRKFFHVIKSSNNGVCKIKPIQSNTNIKNNMCVFVDAVPVDVVLQVGKKSVSSRKYLDLGKKNQSKAVLMEQMREMLFSMQPPVIAVIPTPKMSPLFTLVLEKISVDVVFVMPNGEEVDVHCFGDWKKIPDATKIEFVKYHMRNKLVPPNEKLEISPTDLVLSDQLDYRVMVKAPGWQIMEVRVEGIEGITGRFLQKQTEEVRGCWDNIKKWVEENRIFWPPEEAEIQIAQEVPPVANKYTLSFCHGGAVKFKQDNHEIVVYVSVTRRSEEDLKNAFCYRTKLDGTQLTLEGGGNEYIVKEARQDMWFSYNGTVQSLKVEPDQSWEQIQSDALKLYELDPKRFQCCGDEKASDSLPIGSATDPVMIVHAPVTVIVKIKNGASDDNLSLQVTIHDTVSDIGKKIRELGICTLPIIRLMDGPVIPQDTTIGQIQNVLDTDTVELLAETEVEEVKVKLLIGDNLEERPYSPKVTIGELRTQLAQEMNERKRETISILYAGKCLADELEIGQLVLNGKRKLVVFMQSQEPLLLQSVKVVKCCFSFDQHEYTLALPLWLSIAEAKKRLAQELQKGNIPLKDTDMEFVIGADTLDNNSVIGELGLRKRDKIIVTRIRDPRESWLDCITPEERRQVLEVQRSRSYLNGRSPEELLKLFFEVDRNLDIFKARAAKRWDPMGVY